MEHSLAFDLHIMLCLPASAHLYISSDKIRAFSLKLLDCDTVLLLGAAAKHHICIARLFFLTLACRSKPGHRCSVIKWDVSPPRCYHLCSGVPSAPQKESPGIIKRKLKRSFLSCYVKRINCGFVNCMLEGHFYEQLPSFWNRYTNNYIVHNLLCWLLIRSKLEKINSMAIVCSAKKCVHILWVSRLCIQREQRKSTSKGKYPHKMYPKT